MNSTKLSATPRKNKHVEIPRSELTFDERYHILRRLRFWSDLFMREAEEKAMVRERELDELVEGLEEKRFVVITPDFAERCEQKLMREHDPVELWRFGKGLNNHRFQLLEETKALFPEQHEKLKHFYVVWRD